MTLAFRPLLLSLLGWLALCPSAFAEPSLERHKLYTKPDPASPGGITGSVAHPTSAIEQVLAIPPDAPEQVYEGRIEGADKRSFRFTGLPMRKYDLIVICKNSFYEGLQLMRGESSLTDDDRKKVDTIVRKSEPFFTDKIVHRLEGVTGRGNQARGICTFLRARGSELLFEAHEGKYNREDFRRTLKLVILKDVGPGWQVVRTRDLYPTWIDPKSPELKHHYTASLSGVRVADSIKDLGALDLTQ